MVKGLLWKTATVAGHQEFYTYTRTPGCFPTLLYTLLLASGSLSSNCIDSPAVRPDSRPPAFHPRPCSIPYLKGLPAAAVPVPSAHHVEHDAEGRKQLVGVGDGGVVSRGHVGGENLLGGVRERREERGWEVGGERERETHWNGYFLDENAYR